MNDPFDDIINLDYPFASRHPRMSMWSRAAQFAPFAALTGHDEAVRETARFTDSFIERDEEELSRFNRILMELRERITEHPEVVITYFVHDAHKSGGETVELHGRLCSIDDFRRMLVLCDGTEVAMGAVVDLCCIDKD